MIDKACPDQAISPATVITGKISATINTPDLPDNFSFILPPKFYPFVDLRAVYPALHILF